MGLLFRVQVPQPEEPEVRLGSLALQGAFGVCDICPPHCGNPVLCLLTYLSVAFSLYSQL